MTAPAGHERVLVIKLGAFGDMIAATRALQAIRLHHARAQISLLSTPGLGELGMACGGFDLLITRVRTGWRDIPAWLGLARHLRRLGFGRVYDLQNARRSSWLFPLLGGTRSGPEWSGCARGATFPVDFSVPGFSRLNGSDKLLHQLGLCGIRTYPPHTLDWLEDRAEAQVSRLEGQDFAVLVPGSSSRTPGKRWPADGYVQAARALAQRGLVPVLAGAGPEAGILEQIAGQVPGAVNLCDRTGYRDLAWLGRRAALVVGNDTGPMHLLIGAGAPGLVLFGPESDPACHGPLAPPGGGPVRCLVAEDFRRLDAETVLRALPQPRAGTGGGSGSREGQGQQDGAAGGGDAAGSPGADP